MKKQFLNLGKALNKAEQRSINGGKEALASFACYCGFVGGPYQEMVVFVEADSVVDALNSMNCGGEGVTCNGQ